MLTSIISLVSGFLLLIWSADAFTNNGAKIAKIFNISPLIIGLLIFGFGTSAPEMIVSGMAAYEGPPEMSIGNAFGSNIFNIALVLGITFKENCPDIRNSRVIDIIEELQSYHVNVDVYDPWASKAEVKHEYGLDLISDQSKLGSDYEAIILAVSHKEFLEINLNSLKADECVTFDVKSLLPLDTIDARL